MIPREILKKIRQIELRTNRIVTASAARGCARIPKGFRLKAQGCDVGATLGNVGLKSQPQRGCVRPASLAATLLALCDFRQLTQGCEARATLGHRHAKITNRNAVAAILFSPAARGICHNPVGVGEHSIPFTQGSSCVATLGYMPESRWDSPMAAVIGQPSQTITTPTGLWQPA
jgi:hypothetical protein